MYVQLNEDETEVVAVFASPQDEKLYPHQAELDAEDARVIAFDKQMKAIE